MKWVFLFIQISFLVPLVAITINIGSGQIANQPFPINASYNYSYSQVIYLQQEIQHQGVITQISYQYHVASSEYLSNVNQLKIYMGKTSKTNFISNTDWIPADSMELVFNGNWDITNFSSSLPGDGWVTILLTSSFSYDNINNLVIAIDENQPGCTGVSEKFMCSNTSMARGIEYHSDSINPDPNLPPDANSNNPRFYIANIRLEMITDFPVPTNPYPTEASESVELLPQFSWSCNANSYDIYLGLQNGELQLQAQSLIETYWSPSSLLQPNTTYYWKVKAHYGQQTSESAIWSFMTGSAAGSDITFEECFDLNCFPPEQWMSMEGLYQVGTTLTQTVHGWTWDHFGNEINSTNGSARLNIYGRDCYHWLISPSLASAAGNYDILLHATLTSWNSTSLGHLGDDDKIRVVLFTGATPNLTNAIILKEWTSADSISLDNSIAITAPQGVFRIGIYSESTISNNDCDLFIDDFKILSVNSLSIQPPSNLDAQIEGNAIHLVWNAPVSYMPTGYKVYRNNHLIGTLTQSVYTDISVSQGHNYSYFITALNEAGEESAPSLSESLTCVFILSSLIDDSFESYVSFSLVFSPWINLDIDQNDTFGLSTSDFPGENNSSAFMVFKPSACIPPFSAIQASDGAQFLAVFPDTPPPNNDWLITPHLQLGTGSMLSFKVRSLITDYGSERFRVGISTTLALPDSFHMISNEPYLQAPGQWAEFNFDLSSYDGQDVYIAVQCVSYDCAMFAFDEFKVFSEGGYVGNEDNHLPAPQFVLSTYPNPFHTQCRIVINNPNKEYTNIEIFNIRGQRVFQLPSSKSDIDAAWDGKDSNHKNVSPGVYIVRIKGSKSFICKKIVKL
jgi:hypothetical protein